MCGCVPLESCAKSVKDLLLLPDEDGKLMKSARQSVSLVGNSDDFFSFHCVGLLRAAGRKTVG